MSTKIDTDGNGSNSSPKLSLRRETVRVLKVRSGVQTGGTVYGLSACNNGTCGKTNLTGPGTLCGATHISCLATDVVG